MTIATETDDRTALILIAGHWLGSWAWDEVLPHLSSESVQAVAMTLPGFDELDPERSLRTLDDQVQAILEVVTRNSGTVHQPVVLVAHSGSNAPVSVFLDQYPELVKRVIWVDSGPVAPGIIFAPDLPDEVAELPLPDFAALGKQASLEGLNENLLERFRTKSVPVLAPVLRANIVLSNDHRRQSPTTLVCCSLLSEQVQGLVQAGHPMFAEVTNLTDVTCVDLPTGHWPMWSEPIRLAQVVYEAAVTGSGSGVHKAERHQCAENRS